MTAKQLTFEGTNLTKPETVDILCAISYLKKIADELELQFTIGTKDPRYKKGTQTQAITALNEEFNRLVEMEPFTGHIIKRIARNTQIEEDAVKVINQIIGLVEKDKKVGALKPAILNSDKN